MKTTSTPSWLPNDSALERRVASCLSFIPSPEVQRIRVRAQKGTVTLWGHVPSSREREVALERAARVAGVIRVVNEIAVGPAPTFRNRSRLALLAAGGLTLVLGLVLALAGAGEPGVAVFPVEGRLLVDDRPAEGAFVVFHPTAPRAGVPRPAAEVGPDGSFRLTTFTTGDGAPVGEYAVTVRWQDDALPQAFGEPASSGLTARVDEGANQPVLIITR